MKRILPTWCKEVKKSMIDDDINVTELAERVGFTAAGIQLGMLFIDEPPFLDDDGTQAYVDSLGLITYNKK